MPLVPAVLWGTQRVLTKDHPQDFSRGRAIAITVGEPLHPSGVNPVAETAELRKRMAALLDESVRRYPERPPGAWWLPDSYGGSAPTPEQAAQLDAEEQAARRARGRKDG